MTGSAREVIAQEIYNSLEHIDMNDARLGAHDMLTALERAGIQLMQWQSIGAMPGPPRHVDCLFLCGNGDIYKGRACYGLHEPWWTVDTKLAATVLNGTEHGFEVTHWMPAPKLSAARQQEAQEDD